MYLTRTIGRWQLELHQRAIHLTRTPKADPNCGACNGQGGHGWTTASGDPDWEDCHCLDQLHTWRIPLWRRPEHAYADEPF
ncbi:hypothetical protein ABT119_06310 [Streptomyces sp. NPDC001910]|uniref:hypothetical protein n=1 Tax=Streptomyces sp. NPDC001910 TaxID=3154403 RepID=UPI00331C820A